MLPSQPSNDPLVFTNTDIPGIDRRYPFLNGGGRTVTRIANNTEYRSAWCRHGWRAQERKPRHLLNTNFALFGCRGFIKDYEEHDDWDCGYAEEGLAGYGVRSIQVLNPAWDGRFWPFPEPKEWYDRAGSIRPGVLIHPKPTPSSSPSKPATSSATVNST